MSVFNILFIDSISQSQFYGDHRFIKEVRARHGQNHDGASGFIWRQTGSQGSAFNIVPFYPLVGYGLEPPKILLTHVSHR